MPVRHTLFSIILGLLFFLVALSSRAATSIDHIAVADVREWFPQVTALDTAKREIPYRLVMAGEQVIGAVFLSSEISPIPAYSGKPIVTLIAIDTRAQIAGVAVVAHEEPILVIGIEEHSLNSFSKQYTGLDSYAKVRVNAAGREGYHSVDGISGATITVMVLNRSIMVSAQKVADSLGWPLSDVAAAPSTRPVAEMTLEQRWQQRLDMWQGQAFKAWSIATALVVLTFILFFQDWLVRRPKILKPLRYGFLIFTVVFIGFVFSSQLSIVNVLGFIQNFIHGFSWDTLMMDPGIFFLWAFLAFSILLWGRGVFCGWLCPFGAMQELIHDIALRLKFPVFEFPPMVHERLWAIKYFILIVLVGVSMDSFSTAAKLAEVEPFKTSITMGFARDWGYVFYAAGLLFIAAFNSKFYCKYICALGAFLSIFSRFKIFDWLRRRNECGNPCQACATKCQISAIKPTGEIIDSECHYCLDCQLLYWDEHSCPPLVEKRKKRERREAQKTIEVVDVTFK